MRNSKNNRREERWKKGGRSNRQCGIHVFPEKDGGTRNSRLAEYEKNHSAHTRRSREGHDRQLIQKLDQKRGEGRSSRIENESSEGPDLDRGGKRKVAEN